MSSKEQQGNSGREQHDDYISDSEGVENSMSNEADDYSGQSADELNQVEIIVDVVSSASGAIYVESQEETIIIDTLDQGSSEDPTRTQDRDISEIPDEWSITRTRVRHEDDYLRSDDILDIPEERDEERILPAEVVDPGDMGNFPDDKSGPTPIKEQLDTGGFVDELHGRETGVWSARSAGSSRMMAGPPDDVRVDPRDGVATDTGDFPDE